MKRALGIAAVALLTSQAPCWAAGEVPRYKPSTRSAEPADITSNRYGASRDAPHALKIGEAAPDFSAPKAGGGLVSLRRLRAAGPVVVIFYRGHW